MRIARILLIGCFGLLIFPNLTGQITPHEAAALMKKGINLGNTLEPPYEGDWGNPPAREYYFDLYRQAGFDAVRIPVRWDRHTGYSAPYQVDADWMDRVEEVVDWGLERDLYIIINAHHEEWIKEDYTNPSYRARFDSIWSQIAVRFQDKSEKLLFEIINEPMGLTKEQNEEVHRRVLSIIRKHNPTRIVIVQGHNWGGADELMEMVVPEDDYLMGSFHTYDPWPLGLNGYGPFGPAEIADLEEKFDAVKSWSVQSNIPAFLGEFGCHKDAEYNKRMQFYKTYMELAEEYELPFFVWDDGGNFRIMERETSGWNDIKDVLIYTTLHSPANPSVAVDQDTLIRLTWMNPVNDYDSILIQRRFSHTGFSTIAVLSPDAISFIDTGGIPNFYHYYRIVARYTADSTIHSHPVRILLPKYVPGERGLFLGEPLQIPGTIEAEDFDTGGEGIAYHDSEDINLPGKYRPDEGVDIYDRLGEGYHIGNALPGEWYEYTVDVERDGVYLLEVHLAALQDGGTFMIDIGEVSTDTLTSVSSGSWLTTTTVSHTMELQAGIQILRFTVVDEPQFNFDKMVVTLNTVGAGTIQAEPEIRIYVNPHRQLVIKTVGSTVSGPIRIFDIQGRTISSIPDPEPGATATTVSIPSGIYLVQVPSGPNIYTRKVLVK